MKVYIKPHHQVSRAVDRVSSALNRYAPDDIEIVSKVELADIVVLHVTDDGRDALKNLVQGQTYIVVQYRHLTISGDKSKLFDLWNGSMFVWSCLDTVADALDGELYYAPFGIDDTFLNPHTNLERTTRVISTGCVTGPGHEPIEEVSIAAAWAGGKHIHVGPERPQGMTVYPTSWRSHHRIPDDRLSFELSRAEWISGLRHVEGFELPVIEGVSCGCNAIVFDLPSMRTWYSTDMGVVFIPESHGGELVDNVVQILRSRRDPVSEEVIKDVRDKFSWEKIAKGFWERIQ